MGAGACDAIEALAFSGSLKGPAQAEEQAQEGAEQAAAGTGASCSSAGDRRLMVPATLLLQALEVLASTLCCGMELVEVSVAPGAEQQLLQLLLPSAYCVLGVLVLMAALAACRPACTVLSVTHMTHVHDPSACSFIAVSPHAATVLLRCRSMSWTTH